MTELETAGRYAARSIEEILADARETLAARQQRDARNARDAAADARVVASFLARAANGAAARGRADAGRSDTAQEARLRRLSMTARQQGLTDRVRDETSRLAAQAVHLARADALTSRDPAEAALARETIQRIDVVRAAIGEHRPVPLEPEPERVTLAQRDEDMHTIRTYLGALIEDASTDLHARQDGESATRLDRLSASYRETLDGRLTSTTAALVQAEARADEQGAARIGDTERRMVDEERTVDADEQPATRAGAAAGSLRAVEEVREYDQRVGYSGDLFTEPMELAAVSYREEPAAGGMER